VREFELACLPLKDLVFYYLVYRTPQNTPLHLSRELCQRAWGTNNFLVLSRTNIKLYLSFSTFRSITYNNIFRSKSRIIILCTFGYTTLTIKVHRFSSILEKRVKEITKCSCVIVIYLCHCVLLIKVYRYFLTFIFAHRRMAI